MTLATGIETRHPRPPRPAREAEVLLGEDWVRPQTALESELRDRRARRGFISLNRSPLARKIIIFNLLAMMVLVAGVLYLNPFRDSLVQQRSAALVAQAELIADAFSVQLEAAGPGASPGSAGAGTEDLLERLSLRSGIELFLFDHAGELAGARTGTAMEPVPTRGSEGGRNMITGFLNAVWDAASGVMSGDDFVDRSLDAEGLARQLMHVALQGDLRVETARDDAGNTLFTVVTPMMVDGQVRGVVALTSAAGEIDQLVRNEREQVLQMFVLALLVSIGLSLVLASTIANPISDLAAAAELGRDRNARKLSPDRVRIPDLTARPDEIGRLSVAMRGMVTALYDRIEANEQFAADVAHEIKNPLASLRSAVGTLRVARRDDQREKLLDVIEHDVRRLDRLVSDISNASRLDSELVKEQEETFDLMHTLHNLNEYLGREAESRGVTFISDLPDDPILIQGLEARLAQVFVNLITNAVSFCEEGDAVRVWARKRENRVLVVVEDTGPGIPEQALNKIFKRFYSERPVKQFGNHSGLGLAISRQIVEAHGGVIWAENIRPTEADATSDPLGARFVVGLPL